MFAKKSLKNYLDSLAKKIPVPGGGSASALVLGLGIALGSMVANFTHTGTSTGKKTQRLKKFLKQNERLRKKALVLVDKDVRAFQRLSDALKIPKESKNRFLLIQRGFLGAAEVPLEVCAAALKAMQLCAELAVAGNKNLVSDVGCSMYFLESAFEAAVLNVKINLKFIKDKRYILEKKRVLLKMSKAVKKFKLRIVKKIEDSF
ncbi:MAG: cyclodeaminase/cyclohydrolase family protein [Candidatus Omnitrophica bacterium]|nr:cyclodeaminase/cyclohydrolase family protein [Candidatus Omnitrophota bacterium]